MARLFYYEGSEKMKGTQPQILNNKSKLQLATKGRQVLLEVGDVSAYDSDEGGEKENERNINNKTKNNLLKQ
jgi:hypothetical protein